MYLFLIATASASGAGSTPPAFVAAGTDASSVSAPSTPADVGITLAGAFSSATGVLPTSLAVEVAPVWAFGPHLISAYDYESGGLSSIWSNVRISGTATTDGDAWTGGLGVRTTIWGHPAKGSEAANFIAEYDSLKRTPATSAAAPSYASRCAQTISAFEEQQASLVDALTAGYADRNSIAATLASECGDSRMSDSSKWPKSVAVCNSAAEGSLKGYVGTNAPGVAPAATKPNDEEEYRYLAALVRVYEQEYLAGTSEIPAVKEVCGDPNIHTQPKSEAACKAFPNVEVTSHVGTDATSKNKLKSTDAETVDWLKGEKTAYTKTLSDLVTALTEEAVKKDPKALTGCSDMLAEQRLGLVIEPGGGLAGSSGDSTLGGMEVYGWTGYIDVSNFWKTSTFGVLARARGGEATGVGTVVEGGIGAYYRGEKLSAGGSVLGGWREDGGAFVDVLPRLDYGLSTTSWLVSSVGVSIPLTGTDGVSILSLLSLQVDVGKARPDASSLVDLASSLK